MSHRPWVPPEVDAHLHRLMEPAEQAPSGEVWAVLHQAMQRHTHYHDHQVINLNPAGNIPGPRVSRLLGATIGSRPSLGYPGWKYETGLAEADRVEATAIGLLRRLFGARHVEHRVPSGAVANLYAFMATCLPGDLILSLGPEAGGHATHQPEGAAGLYRLEVERLPFLSSAMTVDVSAAAESARRLRPRLILAGASLMLRPHPVAELREVADSVGAWLMFDAAHVSGLIAGGAYPNPLREGAHLVTSSSYKSFGGPPGGFVLTDDDELAERLDRIAFPGLTANFDLARTGALAAACLDLLDFGRGYASASVANARVLAEELGRRGVAVHRAADGVATDTHHLALQAAPYGGGDTAARRLEPAGLLCSGIGLPLPDAGGEAPGVRLGSNEPTRWGMGSVEMEAVAEWVAAVLVKGADPVEVGREVTELRSRFQSIAFAHP